MLNSLQDGSDNRADEMGAYYDMSIEKPDPRRAVLNQSPELPEHNLYLTDVILKESIRREGAAWADDKLCAAGEEFAKAESHNLARLANTHKPVLKTHDDRGRRCDQVEFHEAWHSLMEKAVGHSLVALTGNESGAGAQVARAGLFFLYSQLESGTQCPISMSAGGLAVLKKYQQELPVLGEIWIPKMISGVYDRRFLPPSQKHGLLVGMGMTERQGGSDVQSNITSATPVSGRKRGDAYILQGHKWFMSAPMCDAFLILAQAQAGVSCFFVPRFLDNDELNGLHFQRLKDKLGNHSNASSEVEFDHATGYLLGDEGHGVRTIIEMACHTRQDCVTASAGLQRRALTLAHHHTNYRKAFGSLLIDKPLMQNVLADLALESEASTTLAMYCAKTFDQSASESDRLIGRVLTPAAKYFVCKRGPQFAAEAMEIYGGNGYVEDSDFPRIYREMPLLSIWEGAGNVMCLDVLRALGHDPEIAAALSERFASVGGANADLDRHVKYLQALVTENLEEGNARRVASALCLAVQGALLVEHAPNEISDTFCHTRLSPDSNWGMTYGELNATAPTRIILERAFANA